MAKLSDLLGRKGEPGALSSRPGQGNGNGGHINIENLSDIGSRIDEENEELRSLLTDTGRKIGELDELKQAFDKLVAPFNSTLRALDQEKSQTVTLTGLLEESRAAYETRQVLPDRAQSNCARSREELELSREQGHALESTRIELSNEID